MKDILKRETSEITNHFTWPGKAGLKKLTRAARRRLKLRLKKGA